MKRPWSSQMHSRLCQRRFGTTFGQQHALSGSQPQPRRPYQLIHSVSTASQQAKQATDHDDEDPRIRQMRTEAVLLVSKAPLSLRKLAQLAHLADATEARTLVRQLNQIYDSCGRAIRIEQVAGGYRMLTRPALSPWLAKLGHLPPLVRLSTPMMETLAVIAYRQPVSRASAEAVRGVACGELLRQLMERDLIRIVGRGEELGRPYLYGTTKRFLQLFGLPDVASLPPIQWQTLQEDPITEDSPPDDLSTSTKEPVVTSIAAPVLAEAETEFVESTGVPTSETSDIKDPVTSLDDDEENDFYDDQDDEDEDWDDEDDDWDDDDDVDDDLDDDDDEEDEDFDDVDDEEDEEDLDDEDDDLEEEDWEEVDDEEGEDEEWDDSDDEDEDEDEEEDWD